MATPEQIKAITGLYVAYFDRAPDPAGLEFWINQLDNGRDFATISQDFADSPEAKQIYPFLATPEVSGQDPTNLVTSIYQNLFGRDPEAQGLNFWVDVVNSGAVAVGDMVEAIMMGARDAVVDGALVLDKTTVENRIECALEFSVATSNIPGFVFDTQAYNVARAVVDGIDASQSSVDAAKLTLAQYLAAEGTQAGSTFTLCPHIVEVSPEVVETQLVTNKVLYWGYNPHLHGEEGVDNTAEGNTNNLTNEGPADGGIPAADFFGVDGYLTQILNVGWGDLFTLLGSTPGNIDPDAEWQVPDFGNLEEITIGDGGVLTFSYADGTSDDVAIAAEYIDFITNLIFDSENNTRFFEKDVAADVPVYLDEDGNVTLDAMAPGAVEIGRVDAVLTTTTAAVYATIPPILTPSVNNGGTFEPGFTDQGNTLDDLIVAGTLDLLHTAIIDGGLGFNTLEIDAKGHFAQPKALNNIQQISIENLPNVYTGDPVNGDSGQDNASQYPDVIEPDDPDFTPGDADSVIDLTRARDLQNVTITEGGYDANIDGLDAANNTAGDLHVVGLRNNATLTLQGGFFDGDVYVETSEGFTANGFTVILDNVNAENTMFIADNGPTLNLVSQGGGNYFLDIDEFNNGAVRNLNISGDAYLFIESDLEQIFDNDTPITIDASDNTGGVDLNGSTVEQVTFIGSKGDDRFSWDTSASTATAQGLDFSDDQKIIIVNTAGNNYYDLETEHLEITEGDGNNNIEIDVDDRALITAGDGNNHLQGETAYLGVTFGDGDNRIDINLDDADSSRDALGDDDTNNSLFDIVETGADIVLGDGKNYVIVTTEDDLDNLDGGSGFSIGSEIDFPKINITAGDGGNTILLPGLPIAAHTSNDGETNFAALTQVTINTGSGNDTILVAASSATIKSGAGNDTITLLGVDDDYVTEVFHNKSVDQNINDNTSVIEIDGGAQDDNTVDAFVFYSVNGVLHSAEVFLGSVDTSDASAIATAIANWFNGSGSASAPVVGDGISASVVGDNVLVQSTGSDIIRVEQVNFDGNSFQPSADVSVGDFAGSGYGGAPTDISFNYKGFTPSIYGITLDVDTGAGSATINLGDYNNNLAEVTGAIVAKEGSVITGNDITLFVNTDADLRAASLTGITSIIMDDDNRLYTGQGFPSGSTNTSQAASLTLLDSQVSQLLSEGVDFSTQGETFGAQSVLTIVITEDTVLSDLIDFASWNTSIKLCFVVTNDSTLSLTAEELHKYVAPEGIAVDESNGYNDNQVSVSNAGFNFDPFNDQNGGTGGGTISGSLANQDIDITYVANGYERPSQDPSTATISVNSNDTPVIDNIVSPFAKDLVITGDADLEITGKVDLANDFTIDFTEFNGNFQTNADGAQVAMTIYNFQEITGDVNLPLRDPNDGDTNLGEIPTNPYSWGRIDGNGTEADPVRINIVVQDGSFVGDCDWGPAKGGFNSSGVQQYVLTNFIDENDYLVPQAIGGYTEITVCDHTEDLEVLGLQNNRKSTVVFNQINWGTEILMEGDGYANASDQEKNLGDPDLSEVGKVVANFFEPGANAFVRVTNQGTELGLNEDAEDGFDPTGERVLDVAGIVLNNADRLLLQVEDGDAVINDVTGHDLERIIVTGPEDVEIVVAGIAEQPETDGTKEGFASMMQGLDSGDLKSIDASGVAGTFTLTLTADADLSGVTLTGVDMICVDVDSAANLTMTADQLVALGADNLVVKGGMVTLDVEDFGDQPLALSQFVDSTAPGTLAIGVVTFVDEAVTVDASADFGGATKLVIPTDSEVTMTVAQFETADSGTGASPVVTDSDMLASGGMGNVNDADNKLILTDVPNGEPQGSTAMPVEVDLSGVNSDVDVDIIFDNFVANANFDVSATGGETTTAVISGTTDLSAGELGTVDCIVLQDGAVLTLSEEQVADLLANYLASPAGMADPEPELSDVIKLAPGATATLNINDIDGFFNGMTPSALDLNELVDDWGGALDIGTLTITDFNDGTVVTLPGWTMGQADEIVTPTASANSPEFGTETTELTLTMSQFLDLDGIGTITGDGTVNIIDLANTIDGGDTGTAPDSQGVDKPDTDKVDIDTSGISANKGFITLIELGMAVTDSGEAVFLTDSSDVSGFEIFLSDGQIIGFATEAQASGAIVTEAASATLSGNPTGIVWCFDTWSGTAIDTSNYDPDINTLFVYDSLVNGQNEEAIWTYLPGSIDVQKFNDDIPIGLLVINRVNIFEPFTTAPDGITFDDQEGLQTIGGLTLILEGNVLLGDVTVAETVGDGRFEFIEIFSTFDEENNPADPNVIIQPNIIGDIHLNAEVAPNTVLEVFIDTSDDQVDPSFANGVDAGGTGADLDDGLPLITGTIFLGTPAAGVNSATVALVGDHDITIGGLDYSDPALTRVDVQTDDFDFSQDLTIGNVNLGDLSTAMGLGGGLDGYVILNNFTANTLTDLDSGMFTPTAGDETIILATDGNVDLTMIGASDAVFDIDGVHALSAGTITLTADQVFAIGTADGPDAGTGADAWVLGPGVAPGSVTLNIVGLNTQLLDLDAVRDAGFNIGTITIIAPGADLDNGTTLGGADQIVIDINDGDGEVTLELSAEQYNQLADGTIVEDREAAADPLTDIGTVIIDRLAEIELANGEATIDVTNVNTTGNNTFWITDTGETPADIGAAINGLDNDTTFSAASVLGDFSVTLVDLNSDAAIPDELFGQTIRFSTEVQAGGRQIIVVGADPDGGNSNSLTNAGATEAEKDEKDTNVVWLFDTVSGTPGLDVSGYSGHLGRIWVSDELVDSVGGDVDSLFTVDDGGTPDFTLDSDIIKRIETADLDALLQLNLPINQRVEVTSFTTIAGAEFEIDDPLVSIQTLRMDFGGATNINNLVLDNILGPVDPVNTNFPGDDDFQLLEVNSLLANHAAHYLLPDAWTPANPLPSNDVYNDNFENNVVGDISSGPDRGVLHTIRINTFENDTSDTPPAGVDESDVNGAFVGSNVYDSAFTGNDAPQETLGREGAQFVAQTIYFSDDGDTTAVGGDGGQPQATLIITGENDVTVKSLDTSDAEITALVIDLLAYSGTFTVTGGSPALDGDSAVASTTTSITIAGSATSVATFASTVTTDDDGVPNEPGGVDGEDSVTYNVGSGNTLPFAGVSGSALELIDASAMAGTVSFGVISQVSSEMFTLEADGAGQVFACIGRALDDGTEEVPELSATGVWTVNGTVGAPPKGDDDFGGVNNVDLEIKEVVFNNGGQLSLNNVDICITGDIDMSVLDVADITISGTTTIEVKAGAKLTLTVEQVDALGGLVIFGEGTVCVVGESDSFDPTVDTTFANLQTATVDFSAVTLDAGDDTLEITANGAADGMGAPLEDENGDRVAQTIIGSANNDAVTVTSMADDGDAATIDVITRLGADDGDIGVPGETPTTNTPDDLTPEEVGDVVIKDDGGVQVQVEVDAGFDTFTGTGTFGIATGDVVQVASGAEFYGAVVQDGFVATADTTNDGIAVIEADGSVDETIDVSAAGGANGWTLIGAPDASGVGDMNILIGSDQDDTIIDGSAELTGVPATEGDNDGEEDTFTGNGGADKFIFNIASSVAAELTTTVVQTGVDLEEYTIGGTTAPGGTVTFEFRIGGTIPALVTLTDGVGGADLTTTTGVATALAAALNARPDAFATAAGSVVTAGGENGARLGLTGGTGAALVSAVDDLDDFGGYINDPADADDDRSESILTITGTVTPDETYTVTVMRGDGTSYEGNYTVMGGDTPQMVLDGLAASLALGSAGSQTFHTSTNGNPIPVDAPQSGAPAAGELLILDAHMELIGGAEGGFTVTFAGGTSTVVSLSSSSVLDGTETSLADADADVILDFVDSEDSIDFDTLDAGDNNNYDEAGQVADFATAYADADAAMDGTVIYYFTSTAADGGLLFYDANGDGSADGVVSLPGVDASSFDDSNIM